MESLKNLPIKFAVAGFGQIGQRHAAEIAACKDAVLSAVIDIDEKAREAARARLNIPVFSTIEDFIDSQTEADIMNICTPNGLHIPMAIQAIESGFHVLVEKPMGLAKKDCDNLINTAAKKGKEIFCVLQNRYSPPSQLIHKMISENRLGKIYWVAINCYWNRDERYYLPGSWRGTKEMDGGPLYTQFSHFVDLLYWNFGPIKIKDAYFYNYNHPYLKELEDTGMFHFEIERGGAGTFSYSTSLFEANLESSVTIIGENGTMKAAGQYMEKIDYFNVKDYPEPELEPSSPPNDYGSWKGSAANHAFVIDNVIRALNGEPYEMAGAPEAAASVEIIESVYKLRKL
jgi:UDP-N-acetyl-2-amino-2-deoxyglucuronate dehydrogenase